ncbi:M4 family metallopeptidase [Nitriliruptoraceae bacterium ZYF776]|nr:M4 family metallopeptidase [Profundirhabdus halotolerans]
MVGPGRRHGSCLPRTVDALLPDVPAGPGPPVVPSWVPGPSSPRRRAGRLPHRPRHVGPPGDPLDPPLELEGRPMPRDVPTEPITPRRGGGERGGVSVEWLALGAGLVVVLVALAFGGAAQRMAGAFGSAACQVISAVGGSGCDTPLASEAPGGGAGDPDGGAGDPDAGGTPTTPGSNPDRPDLEARPDRPGPDRRVEDEGSDDRRHEGDPVTGNDEVDGLYEAFERFDAYLWDAFGRHGYDGRGSSYRGHVNDPDTENNAYYTPGGRPAWLFGHERTVYGTGMATPDIVAHELAHALVENEVGLRKESDDHALNEALADMFASNVVDSWVIGEGSAIGVIRDMSDPSRLGHPMHVDDFLPPTDRTDHQHANSGIPSHAYHLLAEDLGRGDAEQILYRAVTDHLTSDGGFEGFRSSMLAAAEDLYGAGSDQRSAVDDAFAAVGLDGTWEPPS